MTIQYAQKQLILGSKNGLKLTKIVHIAQMSTDKIRILFREEKQMEIKKNITINLSENDVKEIITDYLKREGYDVTVNDVTLSIGSRCEGYGDAEHEVIYFKGAYINCKEE